MHERRACGGRDWRSALRRRRVGPWRPLVQLAPKQGGPRPDHVRHPRMALRPSLHQWGTHAIRQAAGSTKLRLYDCSDIAFAILGPIEIGGAAHEPRTRFVAPAIRLQCELDAVRSLGGDVWRVERPGLLAPPGGDHATETARPGRIVQRDARERWHDRRTERPREQRARSPVSTTGAPE